MTGPLAYGKLARTRYLYHFNLTRVTTIEPPAEEHIHLPAPSYWPAVLALGFMGMAMGVIFKIWPLAAAGLGVLLISFGAWLWSNVRERAGPAAARETLAAPLISTKLGMWLFLGSEVMFFGALISRFIAFRVVAVEDPRHILNIPLTAANTFVLLCSSLTVVLSLSAIQQGNNRRLALGLAATAVLGSIFLGIQAFEYNKLFQEGITFGPNSFGNAFFSLTGFHGLHVFIGVVYCLVIMGRALRGAFSAHENLGVEIFGLYWHFVDVVWILIFTLVYLI